MKSIISQIEILREKLGLIDNYEQVKAEILNDPIISEITKNLSHDEIEMYLPELENVRQSFYNCKSCSGLSECNNQMTGYKTVSKINEDGTLSFYNKPCKYYKQEENQKKQKSLIKSYYVSEELRDVSFMDIELDNKDDATRGKIRNFLLEYAKKTIPGKDQYGIYLYGWYGSGKTFMMWALINELSKRGFNSIIVYFPDFVRELKSSLKNNEINIEDKIKAIKEVQFLVLDDIGADTLTPWIRDEVIGPILNYRVNAKLPTLYTSNKNLDELKEYFAYTSSNGMEYQMAERIMERIKNYCHILRVPDRNRREEKNKEFLTIIE